MAATVTNQNALLKKTYKNPKKLITPFYQGSPAFGMVPKVPVSGLDLNYPVKFAHNNSGGLTFNKSYNKSKTNASQFVQFSLKYDKYFSAFAVDDYHMESARNMEGGFVKPLVNELEDSKQVMFEKRWADFWRDGWGELSRIPSEGIDTVNKTITFSLSSEMKRVQVGMKLVVKATAGGAVKGDAMTVTKKNGRTRKVTVDALSAGIAENDYIFQEDDHIVSSTPPYMIGMAGICPTATDFAAEVTRFGVDRSSHRERLAGVYLGKKATDKSYESFLLEALTNLDTEGSQIDFLYLSTSDFNKFVDELGSKTEYNKGTMRVRVAPGAVVGYKYLEIHGEGSTGSVKLFADSWCPVGKFWGWKHGNITMGYLGDQGVIKLWNTDGRIIREIEGENQVGGAFKSYLTMKVEKPIHTCMGEFAQA